MELFDQARDAMSRTGDYIRFAAVLERMPIGVGIYHQTGNLFYSNRLFGFGGEDRIPSQARRAERWQAFGRDGVELSVGEYPCARALRGEIVPSGIDMLYRNDAGDEAWFAVAAIPLRSRSSTSISGAIVITQDIEERRQIAAKLVASELRFHQFAENSRNALLITDPASGSIEYASPSVAGIFGVADAPVSLDEWEDRLHPDDRASVIIARRRVKEGDVQRFQYRLTGPARARGKLVSETCFPIRHPVRATLLLGSIVEDISRDAPAHLYCVGPLSDPAARMLDTNFADWTAKRFVTPAAFAEMADVLSPGCLIVDLQCIAPADLQPMFEEIDSARFPVVFLGSPSIPAAAIRALHVPSGMTLVAHPFDGDDVARAVDEAMRTLTVARVPTVPDPAAAEALTRLSRREAEVMNGLLKGGTNKIIARDLGISPRTVELHRSRLMDRLKVRTLSELLRLALSLKGGG